MPTYVPRSPEPPTRSDTNKQKQTGGVMSCKSVCQLQSYTNEEVPLKRLEDDGLA